MGTNVGAVYPIADVMPAKIVEASVRRPSEMVRTGAPSDAVELIVIDASGRIVMRPHAN